MKADKKQLLCRFLRIWWDFRRKIGIFGGRSLIRSHGILIDILECCHSYAKVMLTRGWWIKTLKVMSLARHPRLCVVNKGGGIRGRSKFESHTKYHPAKDLRNVNVFTRISLSPQTVFYGKRKKTKQVVYNNCNRSDGTIEARNRREKSLLLESFPSLCECAKDMALINYLWRNLSYKREIFKRHCLSWRWKRRAGGDFNKSQTLQNMRKRKNLSDPIFIRLQMTSPESYLNNKWQFHQ